MTVARDLAAFLSAQTYDSLPRQATDHAAISIASTLASAACGINIRSAQIIREMAAERGGRADSTVWFSGGLKLPMVCAAQSNAVASDAAASDDSDLRNIVHAGTPLTSAALAIAERTGASGRDVLAAMVVGYEAAGRISEAMTPGYKDRGFHGCLGAVFAAAVASAKLLGLAPAGMAQTISIAATSMGGLHTAADTSFAREYHAAIAVQQGVNAALAARKGYLAEETILEAPHGFFESFGGIDGAAAGRAVLAGMGESWDIVTDMAVKLVPGGHPYHAFAEAAANAARAGNITPDDVDAIMVSRPGLTRLHGPLHPRDLIEMAHSPAYFTAAGVADKTFGWANASAEKIADPVIHRLIDKVAVGPEPTTDVDRYRQGATVTIRTRDGRMVSNTVLAPKGSGLLGIDWADIETKYRTLMPASGLAAERIEASLATVRDLHAQTTVQGLVTLLT